jgi:hypothetical protein
MSKLPFLFFVPDKPPGAIWLSTIHNPDWTQTQAQLNGVVYEKKAETGG